MAREVILDAVQLEKLTGLDWENLFAQLVIAGIAAWSGYFFQNMFRKEDRIAAKKKEIHQLNEAVAYIGGLIEMITAELEQSMLRAFAEEQDEIERINKKLRNPGEGKPFISIFKIEIIRPEDVLNKIADCGKYGDINLAFYRLRNAMCQFSGLIDERDFILKQMVAGIKIEYDENDRPDFRQLLNKLDELQNRTCRTVLLGEAILDAAMFISIELEKIASGLVRELMAMTDEKVDAHRIIPSPIYDHLRLYVRRLLDQHPEFKDRHLHLPPEPVFQVNP